MDLLTDNVNRGNVVVRMSKNSDCPRKQLFALVRVQRYADEYLSRSGRHHFSCQELADKSNWSQKVVLHEFAVGLVHHGRSNTEFKNRWKGDKHHDWNSVGIVRPLYFSFHYSCLRSIRNLSTVEIWTSDFVFLFLSLSLSDRCN